MNQMSPLSASSIQSSHPYLRRSTSTTNTKKVNRYINLLSPTKYGGMSKYELLVWKRSADSNFKYGNYIFVFSRFLAFTELEGWGGTECNRCRYFTAKRRTVGWLHIQAYKSLELIQIQPLLWRGWGGGFHIGFNLQQHNITLILLHINSLTRYTQLGSILRGLKLIQIILILTSVLV
jgi:hypothetical protein